MAEIKLGVEARDKVTGFQGIVTAKSTWLTGCDQYCLIPKIDKDGKMAEGHWFDSGRLEVVGSGIHQEEVKAERNGGPRQEAPPAR